MAGYRPKLILHVGTTKTGTTTLQHALNASRERLLAKRILYPDVDLNPGPSPKHQWLTNLLLAEDLQRFASNVRSVASVANATSATVVVMSTEGLYNHWFDFHARGRRALEALSEDFDVTIWVVFREPVAWAMSMYVQAVKNPPFHLAPVYSTTEPPEAVVDQDYFVTRLQYARFVEDAERLFGPGNVVPTQYESGDILDQARRILGVDEAVLGSDGNKNPALSKLGLDLMLRLNRLNIPWQQREPIASSIVELDRVLGATSEPARASAEMTTKVLTISRESEAYLRERFRIDWDDYRRRTLA
jgi:hypothetical protein